MQHGSESNLQSGDIFKMFEIDVMLEARTGGVMDICCDSFLLSSSGKEIHIDTTITNDTAWPLGKHIVFKPIKELGSETRDATSYN